jgi:glutamate racemase
LDKSTSQPTNRDAPIGVFDSGLGGLSVAREVRERLPNEDLIYYADSAYCPYGTRNADEILARSVAITRELIDRGVKMMVLACNTACAVAITDLRAQFDLPIVGLEPAVKPAARLTTTRRIAVLATPRTIASERLANLIRNHAGSVLVRTVPAPGLVELVEAGKTDGPEVDRLLHPLIDPLIKWGVDVIVLGCTHYPFLRAAIQRLAGPGVRLIDSGQAIARRVDDLLEAQGLRRPEGSGLGQFQMLTSGIASEVEIVVNRLLGLEIQATTASVGELVSG